MLVLSRRLGENIIIGDDIITVLTIHKNQIKLGINDSEVITISLRKSVSIRDGVKVTVVKIDKSEVKLWISAPKNVTQTERKCTRTNKDENVLPSNSGVINHTEEQMP